MMILLEPIIEDNQTLPFPVEDIRKELISMVISQDEFQYFMEQSFRMLKKKYGHIIASVFLEVLQREMKIHIDNIFNLEYPDYVERVDSMISTLESINITTIPKNTPDYELVLELSKK